MKQLYPALILILISSLSAVGQSSVGINTSTPNTKAVLELVSETNNQGFLVPRLSTADRQSMILGLTDRGMMVYDFTLQQFWYWNGTEWKAGLGVLDETTASGDLNGTFPEVYINDDAVGTDELTDIGTAGTYGDDSTVLVVTVDVDGRVNSVVERNVIVRSGNIVDASILNEDIANATIQITKLDPEGETDKVLAIDDFGVLYWEDQSAFTSSALPTNYLFIGNAAGVAQGLPASGDVTVSDAGTAVDIQLKADVVTTTEILDETIQSTDIMDLTVAEADIAAAAVTEQKIGDDAVTAAKVNPDVAGEALIPNVTTGALDVNAGNGLLVAADSVEIDLQDIDGDGIVADLTDKELDVNVDDATLEVASDVVQVKNLGITNEKIAFGTINAEAKISNINFNTTLPYLNRILTINEGSEVEWTTIGNSTVLATNPSGEIFGKPLSDFATNNLPNGSIFVGDGAGNAQPFFASSANQIMIGNGTQLSSVLLNGDAVIVNSSGLIEIQNNAVQGNDIDATSGPLAIAGIFPISLTTTSADGQAIQLDASGGAIDIGGNQGVLIDANNNDIDIDAIAGSVNIDANQNITLTSNNVALNPASNANITTTGGDITLSSGDGISMTGSTGSSFTTSSGDIDINAAGQLDLDGGTTVAINGAGGVSIASAANNVDVTADDNVNITGTNAAVGVTAGTSVDINANAGNVTIDAAGGGSDVLVTAPDQIEFNATNTQVVNGTFELANGGIQVDEIVDELTVDLSAPSDNKLVAETALAQAIADQAGSGLTYDTPNQEIDLGGVLDQTADLVTAAGVNLQVSGLGILDVDTDVDILGDVTLSGAAQSITHTGATSLGVVSNTAPVTIDAQGNTLTLDGDQGVSVDAASNDIDVTAASGIVNVTGNQGVNIDATNNNLSLDAVAGTLVLDGNSGVDIDASTSGDVTINSAAGSVSIDGAEAAGDAIAITASDVSGGIDLTAGTGGIAAVATDGDVSLTTSTSGDVILDGADDVTVTGGTNVTTTATAGTATLTATAGEVDITAGTTVDINASGGNVTIDAVGAGNDILVTAPDQIEFNATNTQIVGGTFELENGGIQVDEIVDDLTVDLASPSDNKLITETALATAIGNQAGSGLTYDGASQEIDLGGTLDQTADLVTAAGVNLQVSGVGILDVDTDVDILGDVTLSGAAQSITHTGATSLGVVSNTAPVTIDAQGNTLTLDGDQGVSVDAASNDIDVTAASGIVNLTGDQGVNIDATNNNLSLDAVAGTLVLDGNSGVDIDASTSGDVTINSAAGSVSIDGAEAAGDAIAITASDVSGGIDLTAGTGGIAAVATDGDVSLITSTTGDVILDGADDVTVTGGTNVTTTATAGTATLTATAGEVDITAGTTVDINASGGNVTIDAVGAGNDILVTAPDQIEFNATNTQIVGGTFELENGGIQVDEIVDDLTVDLASPSDNKLITETALATAIGNQAGSGLTYDGASQEIDLGGTLDQTADLVTAAGVNLQVSGVGILDVDTDVDILGDVTLSGAAQSITHTGATSLGVVSNTAPVTIDAQGNTLTLDGDQGVSVDAASNDIDVTAASGIVNLTGDQGVNIDASTAGTIDINGVDGVTLDASGGAIGIGTDADNQNINLGTAGDRTIAIGSSGGATGVTIDGGTAGFSLDGAGASNVGTSAGALTITGAGGINVGATTVLTDVLGTLNVTEDADFDANLSFGGGQQVTDIVTTIGTPGSDVNLVTEQAVREAIDAEDLTAGEGTSVGADGTSINIGGGNAFTGSRAIDVDASNLTIDATGGGSFIVNNNAGGNFQVTGSGGNVTVDNTGNLDAANGLDVTTSDLTVGGTNFIVDNTGNVTAEGDTDFNGDLTVDGSTFSLDAAGASNVTTSTGGLTVEGADGVNITSTTSVGVIIDANTAGTIDVDGIDGVTIDASGGAIGIGTDADDQNINLGTAGDRTIAIGSTGGATGVTIDGGTAGFSLDGAGASNVGTSAGALTITGAGGINVGATTVLTDVLGTLNVTEDADFDANLSFGGGQQVTDIVTTIGTPGSDVNLVTEQAVREAIDAEDLTAGEGTTVGADGTSINIGGGNAFTGSRAIDVDASNLTIDATGGGSFIVNNNAGGNFQVTGSGGNVTVDNTGNLDAANGLDVTTSDLTVGGTNFIVDNTGNVTAEGDTDFNGDLTVDGSTFSLDAAGASNVTTSTGGLTVEGADGVNITSTTSVGVIIDANTAGTIDVDGIDGVTIDASGGAIGIGTDADDQNINLGTAGDRTIAIGSTGGATGVTIDGGTAGFSLDGAGASNVGTSAGALTITGAGGINVGATTVLTDVLGTLNVTEDADFDANLSFGGGQQVTDIVTTIGTPGSDVNLVTEQAVREAIDAEDLTAGEGTTVGADGTSINIGGGNAFTGSRAIDVDASNLTIDATGGGSFIVNNNAGGNFQVTGSGGNVTVDNTGNLDAANGLDVTGADLTVGSTTITPGTGNTSIAGTLVVTGTTTLNNNTSVSGTNTFSTGTGQVTLGGNVDADGGLDVTGLLQADDNVILGSDDTDNITINGSIQGATAFSLEGSTDGDGFQTSIAVTDPTADRTITLPNASGTVVLDGDINLDAAYQGGSTITATDASGDLIVNLSQTSDFVIQDAGAPFVTATNTGELDIDNLRIDGNTISSTDLNGNILLVPNGSGVVQTSAIDINGGSITGITDLAVVDGGTGASDAATARTNLGIDIGSDIQAWDQALDDISGLAVTDGNIIVADGSNWIVETGATARTSLGLTIGTDVQAYDAGLNSISGLVTAADQMVYTTGSDTYAVTSLTAAGRAILDDANAAAQRTTLGIDIGSDIQAWDQALDDISGLAVTDGNIIVADGSNWIVETGATARTSLGLTIGTDVQAYDAGLNSISGLVTAADQMVYTTGSDTYAVTSLTAAGRAILDDANAAAQRTTLGIDIGSDIQAWDQALDDISGLAVTDGNIIVADGSNWIVETGATARTSLGLTIGTDVQAYDAGLNSISGLVTAADQMVYTTGSDTYAVTSLTAAGRAILDDADAATQRTTLGLGSISTLNAIGSSDVTDNSLTSDDLGTGSVNTDELADDAVTTAKLGTAGAGDANKTYTTDASGNPQLTTAVGFEAYVGTLQGATNGDRIEFHSEVFDDGNNFDDVTNYEFVAPVDGLYHFDVHLEIQYTSGATPEDISFSLYVDSGGAVEVARATGIGVTSLFSTPTISKTLKLTAGDAVYAQYSDATGRNISAGRARSFFSGHLIR